MELLDKKIKEYIASISLPDEIKPSRIKDYIEGNGKITAGKFLKKLREMKISGSEFLELLGNSKIGNIEFRRIEENPHLRFDELLQILDGSNLEDEDYRTMLAVATERRQQSEDRKKREEETLRRVSLEEKARAEKTAAEIKQDSAAVTTQPVQQEAVTTTQAVSEAEEAAEEDTAVVTQEIEEPVTQESEESETEEIAEPETTEATDERSNFVETGTIVEGSDEKSDNDRKTTAEDIIAKIQADIDSSLVNEDYKSESDTESVKNDTDYTESNNDNVAESYYEEETSQVTEESYTEPQAEEESNAEPYEAEEESYEAATESSKDKNEDYDDDFDDVEEEIEPTAKEIASVLNDLVDDEYDDEYDDEDDEEEDYNEPVDEIPVTKKSKGFLIAAFICASLVLCSAGALKLLRFYDIIPNYVFKVPEIIKQDIVDFPTLLEEAKEAEQKISYNLPESFIKADNNSFSASENAIGKSVCLAVTQVENEYHLTGALLKNSKVNETFSFSAGMNDISIEYVNGIFIVTGSAGNMTEVRFYDENNISGGECIFSYKQSGKCAGYYTDGNAFYLVTENYFNLLDARSDTLTSFIPYFEVNGTTSAVPFDKIAKPEIVARINYCTVSRLPYDMSTTNIKSVLMGDAGGHEISGSGLFTCDNTYFNESYRSRIYRIAFDKDLTTYSTDIDGVLNPGMLLSNSNNLLAVGATAENNKYVNAVYKLDMTLSEDPAILSPIAGDSSIESAYCGDEVLTLITSGDKAMQYNINIADLSSADKSATAKSEKQISDELSASVSVNFDDEGKRTGIVLSVSEKDKISSVTVNVKDGAPCEWDAYLDSPLISDISDLPYFDSGDGIIVGLPVKFFDGISQVDEYRFYKYKNNALAEIGRISLYDQKFSSVYCGFTSGDKPCIITLWDNKIITADIENVKIISESVIEG